MEQGVIRVLIDDGTNSLCGSVSCNFVFCVCFCVSVPICTYRQPRFLDDVLSISLFLWGLEFL